MANGNNTTSIADLNRRQQDLEAAQQEINEQIQGLEDTQEIRRSDTGRRNVAAEQQQTRQRRRQLVQRRQEIRQQQQALEDAKTVEQGGIEFRRGTDFVRVAAGIEQDVNKRDEGLAEAISDEPEFVGGIEDDDLSREQEQFLKQLVEFEEAEEEARREERQFEDFQEIREEEGEQAATTFLL